LSDTRRPATPLRRHLAGAATAAAILLLAGHVWRERSTFRMLAQVRWPFLAGACACQAGLLVVNACTLRWLVATLDCRPTWWESWHLGTASALVDLLTLARAGTALRAGYLHSRHGLRYSDFAATLGVGVSTGVMVALIDRATTTLTVALSGVFSIRWVASPMARRLRPSPVSRRWTSDGRSPSDARRVRERPKHPPCWSGCSD